MTQKFSAHFVCNCRSAMPITDACFPPTVSSSRRSTKVGQVGWTRSSFHLSWGRPIDEVKILQVFFMADRPPRWPTSSGHYAWLLMKTITLSLNYLQKLVHLVCLWDYFCFQWLNLDSLFSSLHFSDVFFKNMRFLICSFCLCGLSWHVCFRIRLLLICLFVWLSAADCLFISLVNYVYFFSFS